MQTAPKNDTRNRIVYSPCGKAFRYVDSTLQYWNAQHEEWVRCDRSDEAFYRQIAFLMSNPLL